MTLEKSITEYGCVEIMRTENKAKLSKKGLWKQERSYEEYIKY